MPCAHRNSSPSAQAALNLRLEKGCDNGGGAHTHGRDRWRPPNGRTEQAKSAAKWQHQHSRPEAYFLAAGSLHSRFDTSTVCNMCACTINCIAMCKSASKWHKSQEGNIRAIRSSVARPSEPSPTHRFAGGVSFPQLQYWHITACRVFNDSGGGSKRLGPHSRCACQHAARADAC